MTPFQFSLLTFELRGEVAVCFSVRVCVFVSRGRCGDGGVCCSQKLLLPDFVVAFEKLSF